MSIQKKYKFAIFGKIIYTKYLVSKLIDNGFTPPVLFINTDNEYERDKDLLSKYNLFYDLEKDNKEVQLKVIKTNNINETKVLSILQKENINIGISTSCRNIFKNKIINHFKGRLYNIHDSFLPNERGGALNTWRILNNISSVGNTLHLIDEGIDTGDIIYRKKTPIKKKCSKPIDYMIAENKNCKNIIDKFISDLKKNMLPKGKKQNNDTSFYFPRLYTELNGLINWDWNILDIEKFIRAFSTPYPGAYSYIKGNKIFILDVEVEKKKCFHPFLNGKIITVLKNGNVRVACGEGSLIITSLNLMGDTIKPAEILKINSTFESPLIELVKSKMTIPKTSEMKPHKNK